MGYCYEAYKGKCGRLCCDLCGNAGGVRKVRCPFGYCQAIAACPACRKAHPEVFSKAKHRERGCEAAHLKFNVDLMNKMALLADGAYILRSGLGVGNGTVHAIFEGKAGETGRYIPEDIYRHWNERPNPTLAWFEELAGRPFPEAGLLHYSKGIGTGAIHERIAKGMS
jgi:hypothetical protein